jgi:hypothetical protein
MIEPVTATAALLGAQRVASAAERIIAQRSAERTRRELVRCSGSLPGGGEIGEVRPDGSRWWIRIPGTTCA